MKKTFKIVLIVILSLVILILVFNFSFGFLIKRQLKRFSNNSITLQYSSSSARLLIGSIEFREAVLFFNDVSIDSNSSIFIESLSFEKFAISHLSLKALLFERSFNIEKVLLSGPTIDFLKDTTISPNDIFSKILTPKVINEKSKSAPFGFEIGELEIEQGSFQLLEERRKDFSIGSVNLKLTNISMEDLKVLNGDSPDLNAHFNIRLGVYNIQKELPDNAEILIDSIVYKKDKKMILTGGIHLNGIKTSTNIAQSEMSIVTDLIAVNGFSLSHFLSSKDLKFDRLTVSNTEVSEKLEYYDELKISEEKPTSKRQIVSSMINAFITDTFNVQNFNYHSINVATDTADYIDNLNLWVYSVRVDSNFIIGKEYLRPLEQSTILSGPISMHVPEAGIDIAYDTLIYSGPGKEQLITNLQVNKYQSLFSESKNQPNFQFSSDSILLSGLDEREWIDSSVVEISVYIQNPQLTGSNMNFGKSEKASSNGIPLDKIVLNELNLINGSINIAGNANELIEVDVFNVEAIDLEIFSGKRQSGKKVSWQNISASLHNSKFSIPHKLLVQMDNGTIDNKDMDFEGILFSEIKKKDNYEPTSKRLPDTTRFYTDKLEIDNFDIEAFINNKHLSIDKLVILNPEYLQYNALVKKQTTNPDSISPMLLYKQINKLLPNYFTYINIGDFSIRNGKLKYQMEKNNLVIEAICSGEMNNLLFDLQLPNVEVPEFTIDNYSFCITDFESVSNEVKFNSESICYNSLENELLVINSRANKDALESNGSNDASMQFNVFFPKIVLTKPNFNPISGGDFSFDIVHLVDPEIKLQLHNQKSGAKKTTLNDSKILPFTFLEDGVKLENAKVKVSLITDEDSTNIEIGSFDFDAHEMYTIIGVEKYHTDNRNLFSYLDFHLSDVSVNGPGIKLSVDNIDYDKNIGIISIKPVKQELFSKPGIQEFRSSIDIPDINIEYPDLMIENERITSYGAVNLLIPDVNVSVESAKKEKTSEKKDISIAVNDSTLRNFLGKVDFFHLDSTVLSNIGFSHRTISDTTGGSFDIERVSILVDKLKIDSSHFDFHEKRIAEDIVLQLHDREVISADSMYRFNVDNVSYYYSRDKIVIDSFEVTPLYEREEFFEKAVYQTDRMQIKFNSAVAEGIDLLSIIDNKKLEIDRLTVDKLHLMDHRDQHYPRKLNDFKKLPKESLFGLPFLLDIDTVQLKNSFFLYGEYVDKSPVPGEIYFTNFDATVSNISNIDSPENIKDSLYADITTDIMNASRMTVGLTFPLDKNDDNFWMKASVEEVDLRKFNSMTENLFGISVVRGDCELDIPYILLNDIHSQGSIVFEYDKLKLAMYNRNKAKLNQGLGSGLIDFMLNGILIKSNNPNFLGKTRIGEVYALRNNERSFFNYVWKSTMSGLMSTMGFNNKEQREEKKEQKEQQKTEKKDERQLNKSNK